MKAFLRILPALLLILGLVLGMLLLPPPVLAATARGQPVYALSVSLTPDILVGLAAVVVAVLFDWLPGLKGWYDKFGDGQKRGIMAGVLVLIAGAVFGLSCAGWLSTGWVCSSGGVQDALVMLALAIAINQGFHQLTKP